MSFFLKAAPGGRARIRPATILSVVLIGGSIASSATAGDTERLANCVAAADMARAAEMSREARLLGSDAHDHCQAKA
jgi:hypothetical protein